MKTRAFIAILVVLLICMVMLLLRHGDAVARAFSASQQVRVKDSREAPPTAIVTNASEHGKSKPADSQTEHEEKPAAKPVEKIKRLDFTIEPLVGTDAWFPRQILPGQKFYIAVSVLNKGDEPMLVNLGDKWLHDFFRFFRVPSKDGTLDPIFCSADFAYELKPGNGYTVYYELTYEPAWLTDAKERGSGGGGGENEIMLWLLIDDTASNVFPQAYSFICAAGWAKAEVPNSLAVCTVTIRRSGKENDRVVQASKIEPELALCQALLSLDSSAATGMVVKRLQGPLFNKSSVAQILLSKAFKHQPAVRLSYLETALKLVEQREDEVRYYMYELLYGGDAARTRFEQQADALRKIIDKSR